MGPVGSTLLLDTVDSVLETPEIFLLIFFFNCYFFFKYFKYTFWSQLGLVCWALLLKSVDVHDYLLASPSLRLMVCIMHISKKRNLEGVGENLNWCLSIFFEGQTDQSDFFIEMSIKMLYSEVSFPWHYHQSPSASTNDQSEDSHLCTIWFHWETEIYFAAANASVVESRQKSQNILRSDFSSLSPSY